MGLNVNIFDGANLPEKPLSFTAVFLVSVLHHAAENTSYLLTSAAAIARRWIIVVEDLDTGEPMIRERNREHDPGGIFRTDIEWKHTFRQYCSGWMLVQEGFVGQT